MLPRIASTFANGKINEYMKRSFNMVFLLVFPMILGIISVSKAFVPIFFVTGYDKVATLMSVISTMIFLIGLSNVTGTQYLLSTKKTKGIYYISYNWCNNKSCNEYVLNMKICNNICK